MDKTKAVETEFFVGNLENAVEKLIDARARGLNVYVNFNGKKLYSADVTVDSAYLEVTGQSKKDFDDAVEKRRQEDQVRKEERLAKMEEMKPSFYERGKDFFGDDKEKAELWKKCVDTRINDLYQGMDLESAIEMMDMLRSGKPMKEVKKAFDKQGHSGMSASVTTSIVMSFSDKGQEFAETIYPERKAEIRARFEAEKVASSTAGDISDNR